MSITFSLLVHFVLQMLTGLRALTRRGRSPASRAAWLLLVLALPGLGVVLYFLFGETNIGARTRRRMNAATKRLAGPSEMSEAAVVLPAQFSQVFARAAAVNGFQPAGGNRATVEPEGDGAFTALIADIDKATAHVHLLFYIWLDDNNGSAVLDAVERAAARGVTCRLLIDGMGSRALARSERWIALRKKGIRTAITFQMRWLFLHLFFGRVDLRNHRKIAVIDGRIAYCGSQNCADPEFRVKAKYAPWVDIFLRLEGPSVRQLQHLFAIDWMTHAGEDISTVLGPAEPVTGGFPAIVVGTGPSIDSRAISDLFAMMLAAAEREAIISTPYFVPDETLLRAFHSAATRGVAVTLILPARNDSFFVSRASRSYFGELMQSGVRIAEFQGGLLHAKTMTIDGCATCIGSANMDRRSFELNYENNVYLVSEEITADVRDRQHGYLAASRLLSHGTVEKERLWSRAVNNLFATMGPLL
ncbi:MAG: cardiolipin synthase [Rhodobacteraceae bacterium]|nr:cardiolipin synthase [Paracoccaceae bacterium]